MPLSGREQQVIQIMIEGASFEERNEMKLEAEHTLRQIHMIMGRKSLSKEERMAADAAIETLVRLESTEQNKGAFFRAKRRFQLVVMYLGN